MPKNTKKNAKKKTHRSMLKHNTWIMIKSDNWRGGGVDQKGIIDWYRGRRGGCQRRAKKEWYDIWKLSLSNSRLLPTHWLPHTTTHTFTHKHTYTTIHTHLYMYTHTYMHTHILRHTHTYTHKYTHTHSHTYIYTNPTPWNSWFKLCYQ